MARTGRGLFERKCQQCGKVDLVYESHASRPFCGVDCMREAYRQGKNLVRLPVLSGADNPAWRGGVYKGTTNTREQETPGYNQWKKDVKRRDGYRCQYVLPDGEICGCRESLRVHHKKGYTDFPKLRIVLDNGITYCEEHHLRVHGKIPKEKKPWALDKTKERDIFRSKKGKKP